MFFQNAYDKIMLSLLTGFRIWNHERLEQMSKKLKTFLKKYREVIVYILLGGVATLINWVAAYLLQFWLDEQIVWQNAVINTVAWAAANAFAYPALRKWVFKSKNKHILKECIEFFSSRIFTWILEIILMAVTVNLLHMNFWISKIIVGLIIVVANYIISKLIVFRKKEKTPQGSVTPRRFRFVSRFQSPGHSPYLAAIGFPSFHSNSGLISDRLAQPV